MSTATTFEADDWSRVQGIIEGIATATMQAAMGTSWLGFYEVGVVINPPPESSADNGNPTCWGRWDLIYTLRPELNLDPQSSPYREGTVRVSFRTQPGTRRGRIIAGMAAVREAFAAGSSGSGVAFFIESASQPRSAEGGWMVHELPIDFKGG